MSKKKNLEFSDKYNDRYSKNYLNKHQKSLRHRLTSRREIAMARQALKLTGNPQKVLDLPCGAGRFWDMLAEDPKRILFASDNSDAMIQTAKTMQAPEVAKRFTTFQANAFEIPMEDNAVDHILCMRLFHHIVKPEDRIALLKELRRVTSKYVTFSLWVDGNWKARQRMKRQGMRPGYHGYVNRIVTPRAVIEDEIRQAGFKIIKYYDLLPVLSMWRYYVLEKNN